MGCSQARRRWRKSSSRTQVTPLLRRTQPALGQLRNGIDSHEWPLPGSRTGNGAAELP